MLVRLILLMLMFFGLHAPMQPVQAFRADAVASNAAMLTWMQVQPGWTCIWRNRTVLLDCADRAAGAQRLELAPHAGRDAAYVPQAGDMYQISVDGVVVAEAPLRWRVWLPAVWRLGQ